MANPILQKVPFAQIPLTDPFLASLIEDYIGFDKWYNKKTTTNDKMFITKNGSNLTGILYLKDECEAHIDIIPNLPNKKRLKVGTFKIDAHGTNLGQYYISKILHEAVFRKVEEIYITIFPKHENLIKLIEHYGFKYYGTKTSPSGTENVYLKNMHQRHNNIILDYPKIDIGNKNIYLLSIFPKWHTPLFGDSILKTETPDELLQDVSHTNSIHKVYICAMQKVSDLQKGDIVVIYRAAEKGTSPWYHSVATSLCTVSEYKHITEYPSRELFVKDIVRYSVFTELELKEFYQTNRYPYIIKMLYNMPLQKRLTMQSLVENCGIPHEPENPNAYWGFRKLTPAQFQSILILGGVDADFIIR